MNIEAAVKPQDEADVDINGCVKSNSRHDVADAAADVASCP